MTAHLHVDIGPLAGLARQIASVAGWAEGMLPPAVTSTGSAAVDEAASELCLCLRNRAADVGAELAAIAGAAQAAARLYRLLEGSLAAAESALGWPG